MKNIDNLLTAEELAKKLKRSRSQIWRLTRAGTLPVVKLNQRGYLYSLDSVIEALQNLEVPVRK